MAEERNVGLARATEPRPDADDDVSKEELQRRMEEVRESITQTVTEIKDTVATQYQQVKTSISETLDWREQYRRHTVEFSLGAFGAGLLVGYGCAAAFSGGRDADDDEYEEEAELTEAPRSYAAQAITGATYAPASQPVASQSSLRQAAPPAQDVGPDSHAPYGASAASAPGTSVWGGASADAEASAAEEPQGPGLLERFKETKAYDRLQAEISTLGSRAVDELSKTAQNVVLPAILGKLKDMIGIDLSTQREVAQRSQLEHQTAKSTAGTSAAAEGAQGASAGAGGSSSYGTGGTGGGVMP